MSRVAIITFHHIRNFGAGLQAWALVHAVEELGHQVQVIDFRPAALREVLRLGLRSFTTHLQLLSHRRFARFHRRCLRLTPRRYTTGRQLADHPPDADIFLCGSDQIWNPVLFGLMPEYFLDFAPRGARRVAYAPSMGGHRPAGEQAQRMAQLIGGIDVLSAREQGGVETIRQLTGRSAQWVCDPTLLLDPGVDIAAEVRVPRPWIMTYTVDGDSPLPAVVAAARERLGLHVVAPGPAHVRGVTDWRLAAGPRQWLGYVRGASLVITNSFHGTVFALRYRRPFIVVPHTTRNQRIASLLQLTGLTDLMYDPQVDLGRTLDAARGADLAAAWDRLRPHAQQSRDFLRDALAPA